MPPLFAPQLSGNYPRLQFCHRSAERRRSSLPSRPLIEVSTKVLPRPGPRGHSQRILAKGSPVPIHSQGGDHRRSCPLHWRRKQWRQGNQAYELAREFCTQSDLRLSQALRRIRATSTQTKLNRKERLTNLRGAFRIHKSALAGLQGSTIILLDDVFTTGATAHECTKVLLKDGSAKNVIILTLVRG